MKSRNTQRVMFALAGLIIMFLLVAGAVALFDRQVILGEPVRAESLFDGTKYYVFPEGGNKENKFIMTMPPGKDDLGVKLEGATLMPPRTNGLEKWMEKWKFTGFAVVDGIQAEVSFEEEGIMVIKRPQGLDDRERNRAEFFIIWEMEE